MLPHSSDGVIINIIEPLFNLFRRRDTNDTTKFGIFFHLLSQHDVRIGQFHSILPSILIQSITIVSPSSSTSVWRLSNLITDTQAHRQRVDPSGVRTVSRFCIISYLIKEDTTTSEHPDQISLSITSDRSFLLLDCFFSKIQGSSTCFFIRRYKFRAALSVSKIGIYDNGTFHHVVIGYGYCFWLRCSELSQFDTLHLLWSIFLNREAQFLFFFLLLEIPSKLIGVKHHSTN